MADEKMTLANQQKEMLDAFRELAKEGNGSVGEAELRELLLNLGDALDGDQVEELMKEVSVSADGGISYDSFVDMLVTGYPALAST
ncbi:EF-hand domain-containing protein [Streptomyces parvus]|uniref:EF-hand domain-containing protein n=1 Tax=Streptomyces TaxID=1883 RepID=UPI0037BBCA59